MALELFGYFLIFWDDGVYRHPLSADPQADHLPRGTWALSQSHQPTYQPCSAFLSAARLKLAWIVQTTSVFKRTKDWTEQLNTDTFIMDYFSIQEITVLG